MLFLAACQDKPANDEDSKNNDKANTEAALHDDDAARAPASLNLALPQQNQVLLDGQPAKTSDDIPAVLPNMFNGKKTDKETTVKGKLLLKEEEEKAASIKEQIERVDGASITIEKKLK